MEEKKPFEKLLTRNVYAILDGDTTFGEYKSVGGKTVIIGLPYLSGPALCELSTTFGYPVQYTWKGSNQSRWSYVEDILKHCIKNDTCSRLLEYMFSFSRFENAFHGLERNEMDSVYKQCVQKTIEGINGILIFSNSALVFRDKRFQIVSSERQYNSEESLSEILGEHKEDPFSSITEYERCESVGRGGFGEVYRYHNQNLDMDFAVKIYRPWFVSDTEREEGEKRFFREAKILFSLNHSNIVRIYDAGRIEGDPFIRMEFLQGKNLEDLRSEKGNLNQQQAARAITQVLSGLNCAHEARIIHRDLKPTNVMVVTGERYVCKIIDFGISAFMETEGYTRLTRTGEHIAGGQYIDPILTNDPKLRDPRSDIYSAGAILYFLLCGRAPVGSDIREYLHSVNENVTPVFENIIMKSLSTDLDSRYSTCNEFIEALKPFR